MSIDNLNMLNYITNTNLNKVDNLSVYNKLNVEEKSSEFKSLLDNAINLANRTDAINKAIDEKLVTGDINNLHSIMIAGEKANIALSLTVQVRNKILNAYNEIMNMQI